MGMSISAAPANRDFSTLLRKVRGGASFVVTSHGRPVARIVPVAAGAGLARSARKTLFQRLAAAPVVDAGRLTRDELYEDEP